MSYVILIFGVAAFVFAFLFIRSKFKKPESRSTKWLLLFLACIVPMVVCFVILASSAKTTGGLYEYFINGLKVGEQFVSSGEMRRGNILATILMAGPVTAGAIMVLALALALVCRPFFALSPMPRQRPVKKGYIVWSVFCMGPYFLGLVPMYLTLKAARSEEYLAAGYHKKAKTWLAFLTVATAAFIAMIFALIAPAIK